MFHSVFISFIFTSVSLPRFLSKKPEISTMSLSLLSLAVLPMVPFFSLSSLSLFLSFSSSLSLFLPPPHPTFLSQGQLIYFQTNYLSMRIHTESHKGLIMENASSSTNAGLFFFFFFSPPSLSSFSFLSLFPPLSYPPFTSRICQWNTELPDEYGKIFYQGSIASHENDPAIVPIIGGTGVRFCFCFCFCFFFPFYFLLLF